MCCVTCERTALGSDIVCCVTCERTALGSGIVLAVSPGTQHTMNYCIYRSCVSCDHTGSCIVRCVSGVCA